MSASRDKTQKIAFVYSNLYQVYKKGKAAAQQAQVPGGSAVIKADDLRAPVAEIKPFEPIQLIGKHVAKPEALAQAQAQAPVQVQDPAQTPAIQNHALESLKENLKSLNDLHSRLKFMLKELEDLVKD